MAKYDLPTMIEYVLDFTQEGELFYAGHSMGTTAFMAMHHYRPDMSEKWEAHRPLTDLLNTDIFQDQTGQPPGPRGRRGQHGRTSRLDC